MLKQYWALPWFWKIALPLGALLVTWAGLQAFYLLWASSIAADVARYIPLNGYYVTAISTVLFVLISVAFSYIISLFPSSRRIGYVIVTSIVVGSNLLLGVVASGTTFLPTTGTATQCYVINDGSVSYYPVRSGDAWKFDPKTGRPCNLVTSEILPLLNRYERRQFPQRLTEPETFFDGALPDTAVVWYARASDKKLELFDGDGFHPTTGERLSPVTPAVVAEWEAQRTLAKPPRPLEGSNITFFDTTSGDALVWYWQSPSGDFEFFDRAGFHPQDGKPLLKVTRDVVSRYRDSIVDRQQAEEEQSEAEASRLELVRVSGNVCDQLAGNPFDQNRSRTVSGVSFGTLAALSSKAVAACTRAVESDPSQPRYSYQLARALQAQGSSHARDQLEALIEQGYPAAYDNLGWILLEGSIANAPRSVALFETGAGLGDAQAMVSMGQILLEGKLVKKDEERAIAYLRQAAELGHPQAAAAVEEFDKKTLAGKVVLGVGLTILSEILNNSKR